jgi:hypothetical protein
MEPRYEVRRDDAAEPQPHPDFAGTDNEEATADPERHRDGKCRRHQASRGEEIAGQPDCFVPEPDPFVRHAGAPHAEDEHADKGQRAGILDGVRNELRRRPEGGAGVEAPDVIDRVEGEAGGQRQRKNRRQINGRRASAQDLQQHDEAADVGGRPGQKEDERRSRAQALERQRRRHGRGRRGAGVKRNAEDQHQHHRGDTSAPDALEQFGRERNRDDRGEDDAEDEPIADIVEQLDEAVADDAPGGIYCGGAPMRTVVGCRSQTWGVVVAVIVNFRDDGLVGRRIFSTWRQQPGSGVAWTRDTEKVRGEAGCNGRRHPGDRPEHGHDRVREGVGEADAVDPGFWGGDEECDRCSRGGSLFA